MSQNLNQRSSAAAKESTTSWRALARWLRQPALPSLPWLAWALPASVLALAITSVPIMVGNDKGLPRYRTLTTQLREVHAQNARLEREVRTLREDVQALGSDPSALQAAARELGMIEDGEYVVLFGE